MNPKSPGKVSIVIVNYQGTDDTLACLEGIGQLDWPIEDLEVIVVDNASGNDDDGTDGLKTISARFPTAKIIALKENTGFAGGCNRGVDAATGKFVAFLNNDARPDPGWLLHAITALEADLEVGCVASKVLDWDGNTIDFVDAALSFYGHGFKLHAGMPHEDGHDDAKDILFASGAAMVMRRETFLNVGGFDERYFMFFEDVDLGWRLWLLGHRVRYVPKSLVFHRHHSTMARFASWREHYLLERNALFTIYKNYSDENLATALPAAMALAIRRGVALGGNDPHALDLQRGVVDEQSNEISISKQTIAPAYAIDAFVEEIPGLHATRIALQEARQRTDAEITRMFRLPLHPNIDHPYFLEGFASTTKAFGVDRPFSPRRKIVVATGDTLRKKMAGPAIRAWQIALALSREHEVELVTTQVCELSHPEFAVRQVNGHDLQKLEAWCDVLVFQGFLMHEHPALHRSKKVIVVDIYDPFHLEQLEQARDLGETDRRLTVRSATEVLNQQLTRGDFFLCASTKQRDFWLGQLAAVGRINPLTYDDSENLEKLITLMPFGVADTPPVATKTAIKGVVPGIGLDDKVILWGGGIYNWFDPLTLLRAIDKLRRRVPEVRLYFLGLKHPNPFVPEMQMALDTRALAQELDMVNTHVFFNEGWVAYEDRQNYLLEADIGVSTHLDHVETAFSFRTRILDYLWASLPVVATAGDSLADLIEHANVGQTVPPGDVDALEEALFVLLSDESRIAECKANMSGLTDQLRWSVTLQPLIEFCRNPHRAPDLLDPDVVKMISSPMEGTVFPPVGWRQDVRLVTSYLREGGPMLLVRRVFGRLRRLRSS
ncbi:MAG: glycosyltransferase [Acidimicrobiales bacterium]